MATTISVAPVSARIAIQSVAEPVTAMIRNTSLSASEMAGARDVLNSAAWTYVAAAAAALLQVLYWGMMIFGGGSRRR